MADGGTSIRLAGKPVCVCHRCGAEAPGTDDEGRWACGRCIDGGTVIPPTSPSSDRLPVLYQPQERNENRPQQEVIERSLQRDIDAYLSSKRRRLTAASERGYRAILDDLAQHFPQLRVTDFEPPAGALLIEDFLSHRWGDLAPRTFNKAHSVISDFFDWYVARTVIARNPMAMIDRAKTRAVHRTTFSADQRAAILDANPEPRDQIALRLLLDYGIRKGALRGIRLEHFDRDTRRLTVFTKGEKIHVLPIVDGHVWMSLMQLGEPAVHYLLPKQTTRRRTPPQRKALLALGLKLDEARDHLSVAAKDEQCARELGQTLGAIDDGRRWLALAVEAASTQVRVDHRLPIGEHGCHLWWYRCLQRAGVVDKGVTSGERMHKARHSAIQAVLDSTGNLKAAQALAGHSTVATTGDIYSGWDDVRLEDTMQIVHGTHA